jgi:hypothetical protein
MIFVLYAVIVPLVAGLVLILVARTLRTDRTLGASFRELAGRYGVSKSTAHRVCAGQTYRVD